jgi:hypothetical protein
MRNLPVPAVLALSALLCLPRTCANPLKPDSYKGLSPQDRRISAQAARRMEGAKAAIYVFITAYKSRCFKGDLSCCVRS